MEMLFELIGEIVGGIYFGFAELIVPEKAFTKKQRRTLKSVCMIVMLGALAVLWAEIIFLVDGYGYTEGVIMTSVGGTFVLIHILLGVIMLILGNKRKKKGKKGLTDRDGGSKI